MAQSPESRSQREGNGQLPQSASGERPLTDVQKIVRKHLSDPNHVITDEDLASVRVGVAPADLDPATEARFGDESTRDEVERHYLGHEVKEDEESGTDKPISPWDTIDPK